MTKSFPNILELTSPVTRDQLMPLDNMCEVVQTALPLTDSDHEKVATFLRNYPNVSFRVYGHYDFDGYCDLKFLRHYTSLKNFQVDLYKLASLDGIEYLPDDLELLSLGRTKKRLSLKPIEKFVKLKELAIEGHTKDIESIVQVSQSRAINVAINYPR